MPSGEMVEYFIDGYISYAQWVLAYTQQHGWAAFAAPSAMMMLAWLQNYKIKRGIKDEMQAP